MQITLERITELKALCDATTPGPWISYEGIVSGNVPGKDADICVALQSEPEMSDQEIADIEFIVQSRTALPEALVEIERLRNEVDKVRGAAINILDRNGKLIAYAGKVYTREKNVDAKIESVQAANAILTEENERLSFRIAEIEDRQIDRLKADIISDMKAAWSGGPEEDKNQTPDM